MLLLGHSLFHIFYYRINKNQYEYFCLDKIGTTTSTECIKFSLCVLLVKLCTATALHFVQIALKFQMSCYVISFNTFTIVLRI